jgi:hypothetical protein
MKILECDKTDCPANSHYVPPVSINPLTSHGHYHSGSTSGYNPYGAGGGGAYTVAVGAGGSGGNAGALVGGGSGAIGMATINGVPSLITNIYVPGTYPVVAAPQLEPSLRFQFGEVSVHPACLMCIYRPKLDMREVLIAEKAKKLLEE